MPGTGGENTDKARLVIRGRISRENIDAIRALPGVLSAKKSTLGCIVECEASHANDVATYITGAFKYSMFMSIDIQIISRSNNKLGKGEEFGIYLLELLSSPSGRDAAVGDLLEARDNIRDRHGERKAKIYFWWQVTRSVLHFAFSAIKRLRWIAVALGFFGWVARQFSG